MPSIHITEKDFEILAQAANDAYKMRDMHQAAMLDRLARKANLAISDWSSKSWLPRSQRMFQHRRTWKDIPSTLPK
jgi:hypothetical protein